MADKCTTDKPLISIIIPAYNEEQIIGIVIEQVQNTFQALNYTYEILIIDDGSTDKTAEIASRKGVQVIRRSVNRGPGAARKTGILKAQGSIIAMLDADGSYDPKDIPRLIQKLADCDMVNGIRKCETGRFKYLRFLVKLLIRKLAEFLSGYKIPDLNTGMKVFKKDIMLQYLWVIPDGFSCVTSMTMAFLCNDYTVSFIPIEYYTRVGKSKFQPIKDTAIYLSTVLRLVLYFKPLKFFCYFSIFLFSAGFIKTVYDYFTVEKMQASDIVIILSSFIFLIIGTIAELIVSQARYSSYLSNNQRYNTN